jgi:hypothetical protein
MVGKDGRFSDVVEGGREGGRVAKRIPFLLLMKESLLVRIEPMRASAFHVPRMLLVACTSSGGNDNGTGGSAGIGGSSAGSGGTQDSSQIAVLTDAVVANGGEKYLRAQVTRTQLGGGRRRWALRLFQRAELI